MGKEEGSCQSEGYTQDDRQWDEQALVEGAEDEIDEDDADDEDQGSGVLCRGLLTRHTAKLIAIALGQHLGGSLTDGLNSLTTAVAFSSRPSHLYRREEVEA